MMKFVDKSKIKINTIYNEDCFDTMGRMPSKYADIILTSPFYNTNKKQGNGRNLNNTSPNGYTYLRYDTHIDNMTDTEYCDFTEQLFLNFNIILKENGVVLYNLSYGNNNREGMFKAIYRILTTTPFTIADMICWKKKSALPNNCSPNKLTRIWETIFVFCRKSEINSFHCNKKIISVRKTGQKSYSNIFNYIEARNNNEPCPYNKATYSTDLCDKLLDIYAPENAIVYDPFMGTGTTAVSCKNKNLSYIGSEISENQCEWAYERLNKISN